MFWTIKSKNISIPLDPVYEDAKVIFENGVFRKYHALYFIWVEERFLENYHALDKKE